MSTLMYLLASLLTIRIAAGIGFRVGLVDHPGDRHHHRGVVPLTGGVAILLCFIVATLLLDISPYSGPMLTIAAVVAMVGLLDDFGQISATTRLVVGYGSGVALATYGGVVIVNVGNLLALGDIPLLLLAIPLTALAVAGLSNAYNMIDGIDGLATVMVIVPLATLYGLAVDASHVMTGTVQLMLVPLLGFLVFNLGPGTRLLPKVFLGDAGSVTQGFLVTASLVYFSQAEQPLIQPVTALWLVTVPLMDMLSTMLGRARNGRKLMRADRSHMHHTLMDMGLGARQCLALMLAYALLCALLGLLLESIPAYFSLLGYCLLFGGHCLFMANSGAIGRKLREMNA